MPERCALWPSETAQGLAASIPDFLAVCNFSRTVAARIKDSFHYGFHGQALAKSGHGLERDLGDVQVMVRRGLIECSRLLELFSAIESELIRNPQVDPGGFRERLRRAVRDLDS